MASKFAKINNDFQSKINAPLPDTEVRGKCYGLLVFMACEANRVRLLYHE